MALTVNLRHLEHDAIQLSGQLAPEELEIETLDELINLAGPLHYALQVQKMEHGLLVQGELTLNLHCRCVRCLKPFSEKVHLRDWTVHLALQGVEAVPIQNDCVDLTAPIREDILLAFPRHPHCKPDCSGLLKSYDRGSDQPRDPGGGDDQSTAWSDLDKLQL